MISMTTSKTNVLQDGGASNAVLAIRRLEENTNKTVDDVAKGQGVRIAVLGDSMSAQSTIYADMWPTKLQTLLTQNGVSCSIRTFSVNAHSFFRLNTLPVYGAKTCVEELLEYTPDVVIVVCGHNDAVSPVDGRTVPQIQADALETFATLRAGLPKAEIYYGSQLAYDNVHFTPATLKNKGAAQIGRAHV